MVWLGKEHRRKQNDVSEHGEGDAGGKEAREVDLHVTARWNLGCRVSSQQGFETW